MEKYLFLYLKTGNGHLAPAKAVAGKINARKKGYAEIELFDGLSKANPFLRLLIEGGYRNSVIYALWIYEALYAIHKIRVVATLTSCMVSYFVRPSMEREIKRLMPDKIIVFHFFLIRPAYKIIEKLNLDIPVITVVTDPFTAHPIWFLRKNQNYIVFSEFLKEKCISDGIDSNNLKVFPFVLDRKFTYRPGIARIAAMRKKLGFSPDSRVILIMGGGDGMPRGKRIIKKIILGNTDAEIAVVCGSNRKMYKHILQMKKKYNASRLKVYGYIGFVHSLISISDVVITKCGASTFMEILLMGKIPIINNYIWEQEKGNMEFICRNEMGILEKDTDRIPGLVDKILNDSDLYKSYTHNIRKASIRNGVGEVSEYILNYQ